MSDSMRSLLALHNISHSIIWQESKSNFKNYSKIKLPSHLKDLKEIPLQHFIKEMHSYKNIKITDNQNGTFVTTIVVIIIIIACIIIVIIVRKFSLIKLINCKKVANFHEHGEHRFKTSAFWARWRRCSDVCYTIKWKCWSHFGGTRVNPQADWRCHVGMEKLGQ